MGDALASQHSPADCNVEDDCGKRYNQRLTRYVTAMRNEKPDAVPIRPFVAEFTAKYAGMDCQQVTQDYRLAFDAAVQCAKGFDWDAVVANMVYVWGMIPQVLGGRYLAVPGVGLPRDTGFQYLEPAEDKAWMQPDEYDALIEDPTGYLLNVWMPRTNRYLAAPGEANTAQNNIAWLRGGMAMMQYFTAFGPQVQRLRDECGTVSAIAGILKSPFDIIADKFRGYIGLTMDLFERPDKVMAAAEALMPHMFHVALSTADPNKEVPIAIWMHRGCVPFVTPTQFDRFFWPTLKPIVEELWAHGKELVLGRAQCATCHLFAGQGKSVGPDLTDVGRKLDRTRLFDSVLNPSASIAFGYETWLIQTDEGQVITGFVIGEGDPVVLVDAKGEQHSIPAESIEFRQRQSVSIMPEMVGANLSSQDLADITEFLVSQPIAQESDN